MESSTAQGRPRRYRLTLVATAVATGGVAAWALIPQELASSTALLTRMTAPAEEAQPEAARPRGLRVQVVRLAPLVEERSLTGTVVARHKAPVGFRVAGKVLARHVEVGQAIRAGEPLLDLDSADYELALGAAEAALGAAQAQIRQAAAEAARQASLLAAGWVSQSSYDRVRTASDAAREAAAAAEDQVAIARNALGYTRLVAPTDGVVTALMAEAGQVVAQGQPVVTLVRPGPREVLVGVPEGQVAALEEWQATASLWSDPAARHEASLREVAPEADPVGRTHAARFALSGAAASADLGGTVTVHLVRDGEAPVARLPASALFFRDDEALVWTLAPSGDRVSATPVE
jgi:RND family efflux transporter MFP subunit